MKPLLLAMGLLLSSGCATGPMPRLGVRTYAPSHVYPGACLPGPEAPQIPRSPYMQPRPVSAWR